MAFNYVGPYGYGPRPDAGRGCTFLPQWAPPDRSPAAIWTAAFEATLHRQESLKDRHAAYTMSNWVADDYTEPTAR